MAALVAVEDSVLVVIDAQPGFLRKLEEGRATTMRDRIAWLVRLAAPLGVPVVVTEEEPDRNGGTVEPIDAALPADAGRHSKPAFGLAENAAIVSDLERHGRGTAVLCGLETDVCVAQSALGLDDRGFRVIVVEDAVASPGASHEQGLARMRDAGLELVGLKGLVYEWIRTVERAWELDALLSDPPQGIAM
jgi:nicotinamidase-related amidase